VVGFSTIDHQLVQELHGDDADEVSALHYFLIGLAKGVECHVEYKIDFFYPAQCNSSIGWF
jgi:uncharacterized membrane protein YuzA (DUF378 family)